MINYCSCGHWVFDHGLTGVCGALVRRVTINGRITEELYCTCREPGDDTRWSE